MAEYVGVRCKMCGENIALSECEDDGSTIVIPKPGIPVTCPSCRSTHDYVSNDLIRFEEGEPE
jgi:hypothetical protein